MAKSLHLYNDDGTVCFVNYAKAKLPIDQMNTVFCDCKVVDTRFTDRKRVDCVRANSLDEDLHER